MGFERAGCCVVRGPDLLFGGDVRAFFPPSGRFNGVIGGSPCQEFSKLHRGPKKGYSLAMVREFIRCVQLAEPQWFLLENVPGVPDVKVPGYYVQRLNVRASEYGSPQHRLRSFQFGSRNGHPLILRRPVDKPKATQRAALASEGKGKARRSWAQFCALQGLAVAPALRDLTQGARYRAVGNGVHVGLACDMATAILTRGVTSATPCACGCGRAVDGRTLATAACRQRVCRKRKVTARS